MPTSIPASSGGDAVPTEAQVVAEAAKLAAKLEVQQPETQASRSVLPETIQDFRDAGFFKIVRPPRWGGYQVPHILCARVVEELAQGCPSSGWVYGVLSTHSMFLSGYPEQAHSDVWGDNPEALICSSFTPKPCRDVEGGMVISGAWPFSSGCEYADWAMIGALSMSRGVQLALVPMSEIEIIDDWHVMGLRGTGSRTLRIREAFVPEHRLIPYSKLSCGDRVSERYPDSFWDTHAIDMFGGFNFSCVASGIARKALALASELIRTPGSFGLPRGNQETVQMRFSEAAADIEMTVDAMQESCRRFDRMWKEREPLTEMMRLRHRRNICVMVWRLRNAVEKLSGFHNSWVYDATPMQRLIRDIMVASAHRSSNPEDCMLPYAKAVVAGQ